MSTNEQLLKSKRMQDDFNEFLEQCTLNEMAETLRQTNKYKKLAVNSIAINKIPYVKYPGINIDDCIIIHDLAQEVLYLSMTQNNNNEVAITFSLDHERLKQSGEVYKSVVMGTENETDIYADSDTYHLLRTSDRNLLVSLHNHPTALSFSIQDIFLFIREPSIGHMIVVSNKGELYYMSKEHETYNAAHAFKCLKDAIEKISPEALQGEKVDFSKLTAHGMTNITRDFFKNARRARIWYDHARFSGDFVKNQEQAVEKQEEEEYEECEELSGPFLS